MNFREFDLHIDIIDGIGAMGYEEATEIQEKAIPSILAGKDLLACAQTGTGKTAAFLIPVLSRIKTDDNDHFSTLILVPTRELAKQIDEQIEGLGYFTGAGSLAIYGGGKGENWAQQRTALTDGANIIVATPGRLIAHIQSGKIQFNHLNTLILDEADKMLDMGFADDINYIIKQLPAKRQNLMFSATMPGKIRTFAKNILHRPDEISLSVSKPAEKIDQQFYMADQNQKIPLLIHLMKPYADKKVIVFSSQRSMIRQIIRELKKNKIISRGISSDIEQTEREEVLRNFKAGKFDILVATDVLSRGIDISDLHLVVNFDIPRDPEDYVHRIGRTARADADGVAITLISSKDRRQVIAIEKLLEEKLEIKSITEELGLGKAPEFQTFRRNKPKHKKKGRNFKRKPRKE